MVAHPLPLVQARTHRIRWWRVTLATAAVVAVSGSDTAWKMAVVAAGHDGLAVDTPTSLIRPLATLVIGLVALAGVVLLPPLCMPGALLAFGGVSSNVVSLAIWGGVPDPLGVHVAGGILHFNEADVCLWAGGVVFLVAALWTIWRMPAERFA